MKNSLLPTLTSPLNGIILSLILTIHFNAHSQCVPIPPDLVSWWPGENHANDVIGNNDGTIQNGTNYTVGMVNQSFTFDEVDDYILVEDDPTLDLTGDMTIEAWVRRTGFTSDVGQVIGKGGGYINGVDLPMVFAMRFNFLQFEALFEDVNGNNIVLGGPSFEDWMFHHYVYVRSGNSHELFVDAFSFGSMTFTDGPASTAGLPLTIGAQYHQPQGSNDTISNFFGGDIDEISLYNRALTLAEIQALYDAGADGKCNSNLSLNPSQTSNHTISVYPNPAQNSARLTLNPNLITQSANLKITLFNTIGEQILNQDIISPQTPLNLENLSNGLYYYTVSDANTVLKTGKLTKSN